jgi:hypothetical protein
VRPSALAVRSPRQVQEVFKLTCADEFLVVIDSVSGTDNFRPHSPRRHLAASLSADMEKGRASLC